MTDNGLRCDATFTGVAFVLCSMFRDEYITEMKVFFCCLFCLWLNEFSTLVYVLFAVAVHIISFCLRLCFCSNRHI